MKFALFSCHRRTAFTRRSKSDSATTVAHVYMKQSETDLIIPAVLCCSIYRCYVPCVQLRHNYVTNDTCNNIGSYQIGFVLVTRGYGRTGVANPVLGCCVNVVINDWSLTGSRVSRANPTYHAWIFAHHNSWLFEQAATMSQSRSFVTVTYRLCV